MTGVKTEEQRFFSCLAAGPNNCWIWTAFRNSLGYGIFRRHPSFGRSTAGRIQAHRWSYEFVKGPIEKGLVIDHLCRNTSCVNPDHLEAVTIQVNTLRGIGPTAENAVKVFCKRGHPLFGDNLDLVPGGRQCHECRLQSWRDYRARQRALGKIK